MNTTTAFPIEEVQQLRQLAQEASRVPEEGREGWTKSEVDPMKLVRVFPSLRIKEGFILHAYQFRAGGNGNGIVWAMQENLPFPDPELCPKLEDKFLNPPKPPGALNDVMEAIEGDGSPWSYLSSSIFAREIWEFGAIWHGCSWSTHEILGEDPYSSDQLSKDRSYMERPSGNADEWEWRLPKPFDWRPQVFKEHHFIIVAFYTYSGLGSEAIYRHLDTYKPGQYRFKSDRKVIAEGERGYVF